MKRTIYVVMGHTGEYSDHMEWAIRAFQREDAAKALVSELDEAAREAGVLSRRSETMARAFGLVKELQARFGGEWEEPAYTGYDFDYFSVELEE